MCFFFVQCIHLTRLFVHLFSASSVNIQHNITNIPLYHNCLFSLRPTTEFFTPLESLQGKLATKLETAWNRLLPVSRQRSAFDSNHHKAQIMKLNTARHHAERAAMKYDGWRDVQAYRFCLCPCLPASETKRSTGFLAPCLTLNDKQSLRSVYRNVPSAS